MTVPFREWFMFESRGFFGASATGDFSVIGAWTTDQYLNRWLGQKRFAGDYEMRTSVYRPTQDFSLDDSLSALVDVGFSYILSKDTSFSDGLLTSFSIKAGLTDSPADPAVWNPDTVNGKYYDGVNSWSDFPPGEPRIYTDAQTITLATDLVEGFESWQASYRLAVAQSFLNREEFFNLGCGFIMTAHTGVPPGEYRYNVEPKSVIARYHEPIVNSLSRRNFNTAGGQELVLTGIAFSLTDAELSDVSKYSLNAVPGGGWNSVIDRITFEGQQGQGDTVLNVGADFVIDSDSQITIASMPALAAGTYRIFLEKVGTTVGTVSCYAGAWFADSDGRCYRNKSGEFQVLIDDNYVAPPSPRHRRIAQTTRTGTEAYPDSGPILLTTWRFKDAEGNEILKNIAPIDTRSTERFYEGLLLKTSGLSRDLAGEISDMTVSLSNHRQIFSILRADYYMENQLVDIFHAWKNEPEVWKQHVMTMIVNEVTPAGTVYRVILKDISRKYFKKKIPFYRINADDYPTAPESSLGQVIPEILGLNYLSTSESKGACEAFNVGGNSYICSNGSLNSVTEVYSDGVLVAGANYAIAYRDGGRTFIDFTASQGDNKITFNCKGYMYEPWNSVNGYVQNPAYIMAFILAFIVEVPGELLDLISFDDIADMFDDLGWEENGRIIIDKETNMDAVQDELQETFDYQLYKDNTGRFKLGKKSAADISSSTYIFEQLDIFQHGESQENFRQAVNVIKANLDYYPTHDLFVAEAENTRPDSITIFDVDMERPKSHEFKWTDLVGLVDQRILDELLKYSYGYKKLIITIPLVWIDWIDLYDNFLYQDPYGINALGTGDPAHLYYIEKLDYNWQDQKITITAIDLDWLARQYFIFGSEATLPTLWTAATNFQRKWGFMATSVTGNFSDGQPGKILIDENLL